MAETELYGKFNCSIRFQFISSARDERTDRIHRFEGNAGRDRTTGFCKVAGNLAQLLPSSLTFSPAIYAKWINIDLAGKYGFVPTDRGAHFALPSLRSFRVRILSARTRSYRLAIRRPPSVTKLSFSRFNADRKQPVKGWRVCRHRACHEVTV